MLSGGSGLPGGSTMNSNRASVSTLAILALFAVVAAVVYSQPNPEQAPPLTKGERLPPAEKLPAIGHLGNVISISGEKRLLKTAVANALRNQAAHATRKGHFEDTLNDPANRLAGWSIDILAAQQIDGAEVTTVRVTPLMTSASGTSTTVLGALDETYELRDGTLSLLKSEVPGDAMPTGIITD